MLNAQGKHNLARTAGRRRHLVAAAVIFMNALAFYYFLGSFVSGLHCHRAAALSREESYGLAAFYLKKARFK